MRALSSLLLHRRDRGADAAELRGFGLAKNSGEDHGGDEVVCEATGQITQDDGARVGHELRGAHVDAHGVRYTHPSRGVNIAAGLILGPGSDNATVSFGEGLSLAPAVRHCVRNRCSTTFAITGSSYNCSSSSYTSSIVGGFPDYLFTLRSSVACTFSYTVRFVGTGTLTVNGVGYSV